LDEEDPNLICNDLPNLEEKNNYMPVAGGQLLMKNTPILCLCQCKTFQNGSWKSTPMREECSRQAASAILTNSEDTDVFFIAGGIVNGQHSNVITNVVEIFDGTSWNSLQTQYLPKPVLDHCITKINSSTLLSIGGRSGKDYEIFRNTYFYNVQSNKWTPGPFLRNSRSHFSCGILRWKNPETNQLEKVVVVAGGENGTFGRTSSVELLNLSDGDTIKGEWEIGPEMPKELQGTTLTEYNNSLILVGGFDGENNQDSLYQLSSPNGPWVLMKQTLKIKKASHASFLVPDDIVDCHK